MVFAIAADTMTIFTSHISALHVYSSLFITAQLRCVRFLYRRFINPKLPPKGFKAPLADARPRTVEEVVVGTLTLPPLLLLFPTVPLHLDNTLSATSSQNPTPYTLHPQI